MQLQVHHTPYLAKRLCAGNFDLIAQLGQLDEPGITSERCIAEDLVIIAPVGHPLVDVAPLRLQDLADQAWVLPDHPSHQRRLLEHKAAEAGIRLRIELEINDMQAQVNAVAHGLGIGLVQSQAVDREVADGRLARLAVEGFPIQLDYYLAFRAEGLTAAAEALKEHVLHFAGRSP